MKLEVEIEAETDQNDVSEEDEEAAEREEPLDSVEKLGPGRFSCRLCQRVFNLASNARKHVRIHGIGTEPVDQRTCPHCGKVFEYAALCRKHVARKCSQLRRPNCDTCSASFETGAELKRHLRAVHDAERCKCDYCDFVAAHPDYKAVHEKKVHLGLSCADCAQLFDSAEAKAAHACRQLDRYQCGECDKSYKAKRELHKHIERIHRGHRFTCEICFEGLASESSLKRHVRLLHEPQAKCVSCDACGKSFKDRHTLHKHMRIHDTTARSDPCPECGKVMANNGVLRIHIRTVHERVLRHVCDLCGKTFASTNNMERHVEAAHKRGVKLICQVCGREFLGRLRLRDHVAKSHPKDQPFASCQHCGMVSGNGSKDSCWYSVEKNVMYR